MSIDPEAFAGAFTMNMSGEELAELMMSMNSTENATYENNLKTLGYVDFDVPSGIDIYPIDFESKEQVVRILDDYNSRMEAEGKDEQVITYTDMVGTLMSSVTDIIDIISYVLIAFVAISLHPARDRGVQGEHLPGVQRGDVYHRTVRGSHRHRTEPAAPDPGQCTDPLPGGNGRCERGAPGRPGDRADPAERGTDSDRRHHPVEESGEERSGSRA